MSTAPSTVPLLGMKPHEWDQVCEVLQKIVPENRVWAFGSRATGKMLKRYSDLDLAVAGALSWRQRTDLTEAFEESLLPIKVDVIELDSVDEDFRQRIEKDFVLVQ
jgi:predicted nucleotidyltransferase